MTGAKLVKRISFGIQTLHASHDPLHEECGLATTRHESSGLAGADSRDPALKSFDYIQMAELGPWLGSAFV
ncbi:MAG TPA: hypothetical protein DDY39_10235 [Nitrospira sp.]|nr:hypothetical protein [Nitrospira sp.]HBR48919.1 hypothetical protein [Nitrospira sp.]